MSYRTLVCIVAPILAFASTCRAVEQDVGPAQISTFAPVSSVRDEVFTLSA